MKTRREFFRTLAGSCAVVAACVIAPKSLIAKEELPMEERLDNIDSWITITNTTEGISQKRSPKEYNSVMAWTNTTGWTPHKGA